MVDCYHNNVINNGSFHKQFLEIKGFDERDISKILDGKKNIKKKWQLTVSFLL